MATEAEKVVVELLAKVDGFDGKIKQSASAFGGSMSKIEQSAGTAEKAIADLLSAQKAGTPITAKMIKDAGGLAQAEKALATSFKQAAAAASGSTAPIVAQGTAVARSAGLAQNASRNLGYQISDIGTQLSMGTSPFLILAQQGSQVANALDGAGGALGRAATFLSSWQGALILAAGTLATILIPKLLKTSEGVDDLVEKMKKQEEESVRTERATKLYDKSLEGLQKSARLARDALKELENGQKSQEEQTVESIKKTLDQAKALSALTEAQINASEASNAEFGRSLAATDPRFASQFKVSQGVIKQLRADLKETGDTIKDLQASYEKAVSLDIVRQSGLSGEEKINKIYDDRIEKARKLAVAQGTVESALRKQVDAINKARDAELERYRATETERKKTTESFPKVTGQEVAKLLGTTINSGTRSAAHNKEIGGATNSYHLSGQAIDIPLTVNGKPLTKAGIRSELEKAGIIIKELLGPGDKGHSDHFHIAFDKKRLGPDQVAANAQKADDEESRLRQNFLNDLANLQGDEIDARKALVVSAEEIAKLETDAIEISRKKYDDNLNSLVEQRKLTTDEAAQLRALNDERAKLRTELVQRREDQRKFRMQEADAQRKLEFQSQGYAVEEELLRSQEGIATTTKQRHDIEQRLINLNFDEEKLQLQAVVAKSERVKIELDRLATLRALSDEEKAELAQAQGSAAIAQKRLDSSDQRRSNAQTSNDRQNASPIQSYLDSIPKTADEMNQALESVAAGGLRDLTDGIADAIVNFHSLGDVAKAVLQQILASLIKLVVQQLILNSLGFLGFSGGGSVGSVLPNQAASTGVRYAANGGPIGFPGGGAVYGPGSGTSDSIPARLSNGEYVIRAKSAAKLGRAMLDSLNMTGEVPAFASGGSISMAPANTSAAAGGNGPRDPVVVQISVAEGAMFEPRVQAISGDVSIQTVRSATPGLVEVAKQRTIQQLQRPTL